MVTLSCPGKRLIDNYNPATLNNIFMNCKFLVLFLVLNCQQPLRIFSQENKCDAVSDLANSVWQGNDSDGQFYEFTFMPGGSLIYRSAAPQVDTALFSNETFRWFQSGKHFVMVLNNYATYSGTVNGDELTGTSWNLAGKRWSWKFKKLTFKPASIGESIAVSLSNTVWNGHDSESTFDEFSFHTDGHISYQSCDSINDTVLYNNKTDRWFQQGNHFVMIFNNYATYSGTINGDKITGIAWNVVGKEWSWDLTKQSPLFFSSEEYVARGNPTPPNTSPSSHHTLL